MFTLTSKVTALAVILAIICLPCVAVQMPRWEISDGLVETTKIIPREPVAIPSGMGWLKVLIVALAMVSIGCASGGPALSDVPGDLMPTVSAVDDLGGSSSETSSNRADSETPPTERSHADEEGDGSEEPVSPNPPLVQGEDSEDNNSNPPSATRSATRTVPALYVRTVHEGDFDEVTLRRGETLSELCFRQGFRGTLIYRQCVANVTTVDGSQLKDLNKVFAGKTYQIPRVDSESVMLATNNTGNTTTTAVVEQEDNKKNETIVASSAPAVVGPDGGGEKTVVEQSTNNTNTNDVARLESENRDLRAQASALLAQVNGLQEQLAKTTTGSSDNVALQNRLDAFTKRNGELLDELADKERQLKNLEAQVSEGAANSRIEELERDNNVLQQEKEQAEREVRALIREGDELRSALAAERETNGEALARVEELEGQQPSPAQRGTLSAWKMLAWSLGFLLITLLGAAAFFFVRMRRQLEEASAEAGYYHNEAQVAGNARVSLEEEISRLDEELRKANNNTSAREDLERFLQKHLFTYDLTRSHEVMLFSTDPNNPNKRVLKKDLRGQVRCEGCGVRMKPENLHAHLTTSGKDGSGCTTGREAFELRLEGEDDNVRTFPQRKNA